MPSLNSFGPALLLTLSCALAPQLGAAQERADLSALVAAQVQAVADASVPELWQRAAALRDAARELASEGLDTAVEQALAQTDLGERALLMLVALRLEGGDATAIQDTLAEKLTPLLASRDDALASAAAGLFADATFRTLDVQARRALIERLLAVAHDAARAPQVRLESAFAAGKIGMGDDVRKARALMGEFLASLDAELRAQGALALARSGAELSGSLFDELRKLAIVPDERGRLATSYLEQERVRELGERKLKNLAELNKADAGDRDAPTLPDDDLTRIKQLVQMVEQRHPDGDKVTRDQLLDAAMQGLLQSLDEHSSYLSPKSYARFEQDLAAGYGGIGAYVLEDRDDHLFTIQRPIYSGPAYQMGLMSEDKIVRIDDWPTLGKPVDEVIKKLKGRPGTDVKLYVWRRGMDATLIDRPSEDMAVVVTRAAITIPTEQHQMLPGKIGMIVLNEFSQVASQELRGPLLDMLDSGMQALVLDLRNNYGGLLDEAVNVAGLFLPRNTLVVTTKSRARADEKLSTSDDPIIPASMPIVVLVNRFSASAAEIVAGALQDCQRAVVIGERSFGKGSVQNLMPMTGFRDDKYDDENHNRRWDNWEKITKDYNDNGEFDFAPRVKLTIARYYLPTGRSIHREVDKEGNLLNVGGVVPDRTVDGSKIDAWRIEEMRRLIFDARAPRDYVDRHWAEYKERFAQLADNDRKDTSQYPEFKAFYDGLHTPLSPDDVRQLVRAEIRRRVQDARGQEFPQGDFVEDLQLQAGIRSLMAKLGRDVDEVEDYRTTIPPDVQPRLDVASVGQSSLLDTLDELNHALKVDGRLKKSTLNELVTLLRSTLDK